VSLKRWVFKWRLNVETLLHSLHVMSVGRDADGWGCNRKSGPSEYSRLASRASGDNHRQSLRPMRRRLVRVQRHVLVDDPLHLAVEQLHM